MKQLRDMWDELYLTLPLALVAGMTAIVIFLVFMAALYRLGHLLHQIGLLP